MSTPTDIVPPPPVAIGIVEDDDHIRRGLQRVIDAVPGWSVRFACATLAQARGCEMHLVDLLLLDIGLPDGNGLALLAELPSRLPVLVISSLGDEATVISAIEQGASGYLLKEARAQDLADAIRAVLDGGAPISPGVASYLLRRMRGQPSAVESHSAAAGLEQLTPRETEVLRALTRGYSYEETGQLLGIARNTVGQHIKQIYSKLAVSSRSEAVFQAIQAGWLTGRGN